MSDDLSPRLRRSLTPEGDALPALDRYLTLAIAFGGAPATRDRLFSDDSPTSGEEATA